MGWGPTKSSGFGSVIGRGARDVLRSPLSDAVRRVSGNKPSKFITENFTGGEPTETPYGTWVAPSSSVQSASVSVPSTLDFTSFSKLGPSSVPVHVVVAVQVDELTYQTEPAEPVYPRGTFTMSRDAGDLLPGVKVPVSGFPNQGTFSFALNASNFSGFAFTLFARSITGAMTGTALVRVTQFAPGYFVPN